MRRTNIFGTLAAILFVGPEWLVLTHLDNGRMAQEGILVQEISLVMFLYAGFRGSRWWLAMLILLIAVEALLISRT